MRKVVGAALLLPACLLGAEEKAGWRETCGEIGAVAEAVMSLRQNGVSMAKVMDEAGTSPFMEKVIMEAYEQPRYSTDRMRRRTIEDFRDGAYLACAKKFRGR